MKLNYSVASYNKYDEETELAMRKIDANDGENYFYLINTIIKGSNENQLYCGDDEWLVTYSNATLERKFYELNPDARLTQTVSDMLTRLSKLHIVTVGTTASRDGKDRRIRTIMLDKEEINKLFEYQDIITEEEPVFITRKKKIVEPSFMHQNNRKDMLLSISTGKDKKNRSVSMAFNKEMIEKITTTGYITVSAIDDKCNRMYITSSVKGEGWKLSAMPGKERCYCKFTNDEMCQYIENRKLIGDYDIIKSGKYWCIEFNK